MIDDLKPRSDDPCEYRDSNVTQQEIHLNLALKRVRVYQRDDTDNSFTYEEFSDLIVGPVTYDMVRNTGWCSMQPITHKIDGPTGKELINFAVFCIKRQIGFHSDHYLKSDGTKERIPGAESAGCIRIPDKDSYRFFKMVNRGDCVRVYEQPFWRTPTFSSCDTHSHCMRD